MATKCVEGEIPPKLAEFFHSLPHVNFNFDNVSSTFEPTDADYQQNFWLYSSVPVLIGAIFFLIFTIYSLMYCVLWCHKIHKKQISKKKTKSKCAACLALVIWLSSLICGGCIITGFVFNDSIHCGVKNVTMVIKNVSNTFNDIQNEVSEVRNNMLEIQSSIQRMLNTPYIPDGVREILDEIQNIVFSIIQTLQGVKKETAPEVNDYIETGEYYRWWSTFGILGLAMLTCLFATYSCIRHSRCGFAMTIFLGCQALLLDWVLLGAHLGASIAMSDLCVDPGKTIDFYTRQSSPVVKEIVNYYVECKPNSEHPYEQYVRSSLDSIQEEVGLIEELEKAWLQAKKAEIEKVARDFNKTKENLIVVQEELKCAGFQQQYEKAHCAICFPVVSGLSNLLLVSIILVVFSAVILLLIIPICKRIHHRKRMGRIGSSTLTGDESMETEYHSISADDESLPLVPSTPPPPYDAVARAADYQFHSCREEQSPTNTSTQQQQSHSNNIAPPPPRGEIVHNPRKVTIMAF